MKIVLLVLVELALRLALALSVGYLVTILIFPLAFESYADGVYMMALFAILTRLCLLPRR